MSFIPLSREQFSQGVPPGTAYTRGGNLKATPTNHLIFTQASTNTQQMKKTTFFHNITCLLCPLCRSIECIIIAMTERLTGCDMRLHKSKPPPGSFLIKLSNCTPPDPHNLSKLPEIL